jgi:hypothetical protein
VIICPEDREAMLAFFHQTKKQSRLGNLAQADTGLFVTFATFCENCIDETAARPAFAPYLKILFRAVIS